MLQQLQVGMEERQTKTRTRTNPDPDQPGPGPGPTRTRTNPDPDQPGPGPRPTWNQTNPDLDQPRPWTRTNWSWIPDQKGRFISGGRFTKEARSARGRFTGLGHRASLARGPVVNRGLVYPKKGPV